MVLFTIAFVLLRSLQIISIAPIVGMLGYFVHGYVNANQLSPDYILVLFIVAVLALAWAIFTLFSYHRSSTNAQFVALLDLGFVGAFIAGVYYLRFIANADCLNIESGSLPNGAFFTIDTNKNCALLKASFAFGIISTLSFFLTAILAWVHGDRLARERRHSSRYYRETHYSRRGHRRRGSSQVGQGSRRNSHSRRRVYV